MEEALLHELLAARQPEEKDAIIADALLRALPEETARVARCCCVFHWFDETVIETLVQESASTSGHWQESYELIAALPFIESLPWGLAVNSSTRQALLSRYSTSDPVLLREAAYLAVATYRVHEVGETASAEAFFCTLVAGDQPTAVQLLNEFRRHPSLRGDRRYFQGLLRLVYEAEQLPFVRAAFVRRTLETYCSELGNSPSKPVVDLEQISFMESVQQWASASGDRSTSPSVPTVSAMPTGQESQPILFGTGLSSPSPTVLVVDASPTVRRVVQIALQREHIRVVTAQDGLSVLTVVAEEMPALILLALELPHMDGYAVCQAIRKNLLFRAIPIIMLSGKDGLFDKMRARLAGATEYLTKPFNSSELILVVKKHLVNWQEGLPHPIESPDTESPEKQSPIRRMNADS